MAETNTTTKAVLSLCATTSDKIKDLIIKNGQLTFVYDKGQVIFDWNGKRTFYNQVIELEAEQDRINLEDAVNSKYYFVIETGIFWRYFNGWKQLTHNVEDVVFIGTDEFPKLGQQKTLYVNKSEGNEHISIWNEDSNGYQVVADKTYSISADEIAACFR